MAQCYHYEALRKQRVIDRAFEARCRLEKETQRKKKFADKAIQVSDEHAKKQKEKRIAKKIEVVKRDLRKQEMILRDSNLVMGNIQPEEEMKLRSNHKKSS